VNAEPGHLASPGRRLGGLLIDFAVLAVIVVPIMALTGGFRDALAGHEPAMNRKLIYGGLTIAVWMVLNAQLLAAKGQTIGKRAVGTRIVDLQGGVPPLGKLLVLRYLIPWLAGTVPFLGGIFGLADGLFVFRKDRRCIHDHLAGTRVLDA
jgi:uncharacterized RDD family membrane protein YckC